MRYYLDTEFDGFGGPLISLALVRQDCTPAYMAMLSVPTEPVIQRQRSLYLVTQAHARDTWVKEHVAPILDDVPAPLLGPGGVVRLTLESYVAPILEQFLAGDPDVEIVADWPDDIARLCNVLITGPGTMIATGNRLRFTVIRADAYPTTLEGAVQHNAWWDAMALRHLLEPVLAGTSGIGEG